MDGRRVVPCYHQVITQSQGLAINHPCPVFLVRDVDHQLERETQMIPLTDFHCLRMAVFSTRWERVRNNDLRKEVEMSLFASLFHKCLAGRCASDTPGSSPHVPWTQAVG